jgi:uncharacterized membrane protein YphA (DoxX/SURF4 family)
MAIKMSEPIGPAAIGPLICRVALGAYFVMAGFSKLQMLSAFVAQVKTFGVLPDNASSLYAVLLPYVEVAIGGCLVLGLWTTMAAIMASALLVSFVFAFGFFPGASDIFNKDIVLLGAVLGLLYTGPGAYGLDNVRKPPSAAH